MLEPTQFAQLLQTNQLEGRPLVVALSGGVDSVALLLMAVSWANNNGIKLSAIHVHHGISPNADNWADYCESLCKDLGVAFVKKRVVLEKKSRTSLEQQAREARYRVIADSIESNSVLLTGHHQGDQAETFVLRLMRGAGCTGLSGMSLHSEFPNVIGKAKSLSVLRPFLETKKDDLISFVERNGFKWVEDESNEVDDFDRNFVRNQVLPTLSERWPSAAKSIAQSCRILEQEKSLLQDYLLLDLTKVTKTGFLQCQCLDIESLMSLDKAKWNSLLRLFLQQRVGFYPSQNLLRQIVEQMFYARQDQQPQLRCGAFTIFRHGGLIYVKNLATDELSETKIELNQEIDIENPLYSKIEVSASEKLTSEVSIKWGALSERLMVHSEVGSKPVKQILKESGCPALMRRFIPLLYINNKLVAVADLALEYGLRDQVVVKLTATE